MSAHTFQSDAVDEDIRLLFLLPVPWQLTLTEKQQHRVHSLGFSITSLFAKPSGLATGPWILPDRRQAHGAQTSLKMPSSLLNGRVKTTRRAATRDQGDLAAVVVRSPAQSRQVSRSCPLAKGHVPCVARWSLFLSLLWTRLNVHSLVFLADSHLLKVVLMIWGQGSQT